MKRKSKAQQLKYIAVNGAISANKFYKKARTAYNVGRAVYDKYKAGTKVIARARRSYRKLTRTRRVGHNGGSDGHNDWSALRPLTFKLSKRKAWKTIGKFQLEHSRDIILEQSSTGYQVSSNGLATFTSQQAYGLTTTDIDDYQFAWQTDPFELNPYSTPPANAIYTATLPDSVADSDKYFIKNTVQRLQFVSLSPTACKVEVYWYLCNTGTDRSPTNAWIDCVNATHYKQPSSAEGPHTTAATTPTNVGYASIANPGTNPPRSMRHYWKLINKDQFMLQPGENQSMVRTFIYNKMITRHLVGDNNQTYVAGLTLCPMVTVNGAVVGLGDDGSSFPPANIDRVTYARTKVGFIHSCKMNFAALPVNRYDVTRREIGYIDGNSTNPTAIIDADDEEISGQPIG